MFNGSPFLPLTEDGGSIITPSKAKAQLTVSAYSTLSPPVNQEPPSALEVISSLQVGELGILYTIMAHNHVYKARGMQVSNQY